MNSEIFSDKELSTLLPAVKIVPDKEAQFKKKLDEFLTNNPVRVLDKIDPEKVQTDKEMLRHLFRSLRRKTGSTAQKHREEFKTYYILMLKPMPFLMAYDPSFKDVYEDNHAVAFESFRTARAAYLRALREHLRIMKNRKTPGEFL